MSYNITEQDERIAREQTQKKLKSIVPRALLPNGSYAPVPGIFDIGWKGLLELPHFDFVRKMRELDNSIIKENEQWNLRLAPIIANGELTHDQLKRFETDYFRNVDKYRERFGPYVMGKCHCSERPKELYHSALEAKRVIFSKIV